jgi:NACHT domain
VALRSRRARSLLGRAVFGLALIGVVAELWLWRLGGKAASIVTVLTALPALALAAAQVWQTSRPDLSETGLASRAESLAKEVSGEWGIHRARLLGGPEAADVEFKQDNALELVEHGTAGGLPRGRRSGILEYYQQLDPARLVILGPPGAGKTLLALELALRLLSARARDSKIPVPVSVAGWDTGRPLGDWLVDRLVEAYGENIRVARELVARRRVLPVLDGLDEMDYDRPDEGKTATGSTTRAAKALAVLNASASMEGLARMPVVLTCRSGAYRRLAAKHTALQDATVIRILPLTPRKINQYLARRFPGNPARTVPARKWIWICQEIARQPIPPLAKALSTPWRLTLAITTCEAGLMTSAALRGQANSGGLDERLLETFIPATTQLHPLPGGHHYDAKSVRLWLTSLARHLRWEEQHGTSGADLVLHKLWPIAETGQQRVRRLHTTLSVTAGVVAGGFASELVGGTWGVVVMSFTVIVGIRFGVVAGRMQEPAPSRVNLPQLISRKGLPRLGAAILLAIAAGTAGYIDNGPAAAKPAGGATAFATAVAVGLAAGLATAIAAGLGRGLPRAVAPTDPLRNDLAFGLAIGSAIALAGGFPGGLTGGLAASLHLNATLTVPGSTLLATAIALLCGVALGSRAWLRYTLAIAFASANHKLPRRLRPFMEWAYQAGLLRTAGIAYQFRHDELRKWLLQDH